MEAQTAGQAMDRRVKDEAAVTTERMRAVAAAAAGVIGARTRPQLRAVLEEACRKVMQCDAVFIMAYDPESHSFEGFGGTDDGVASPPSAVPAAGTPGERVVRERRTLVTHRADDPASQGAALTGTGRRSQSAIRAPILSGDKVLGIFSIQSYTPDLYGPADVEVVEAIAALAATALANIELLEERARAEQLLRTAERQAQDMAGRMFAVTAAAAGVIGARSFESLQEILRTACAKVIDFDAYTFSLYDARTHELTHLEGYDAGIFVPAETISATGVPAERVIAERRSLLVLSADDPAASGGILMGTGERSQSVIRTPILTGQDVLGIIAVHSYKRDNYTQRDVDVLEAIASQAATAILNLRLAEERQAAELALRESEASYRALFDLSNDAIYVHDCETFEIIEVNRKACEMHGFSQTEFVERGVSIVATNIPPFTGEQAAAYLRSAAEGEPQLFEWLARGKDGRLFWLEVSLRRVMINGHDRLLATARDIQDRKRAEAELHSAYAELERRVEERTAELARANEALRNARDEAEDAREAAEAANRAKSEFLSRMSHELRTPMNSILGFGQLLARRELPADQRKGVEHILKAGQHLLNLINEVLDLARIEANRQELTLEPVHLDTALREAINLVRPLAAQTGCVLADDPAVDAAIDDRLWVRADEQRLAQVLLNVLSNAVKYNRPEGRVWFTCRDLGDTRIRIGVHDTGRGIPPDRMDELFVPFARLGVEASGVVGTGLGLALSKRLVEAMGGTLSAESVYGEGSTFWIDLTREGGPAPAPAPAENALAAGEAGTQRATVLCIEDNVANLSLIEAVLGLRPNITLMSSLQGRMGVDLAMQHRPDIILLDVNLPDLPGLEVLQRLRNDARTRDTPVIVISADATADNVRELLEAGARAYVTKPIDVDAFLREVDAALDARYGPS
jgi:PAS domain S-box-containing protein